MTSANDARREAAFLYWRLSKNKQPKVPEELSDGEGGVMDDRHITLTALGRTADLMLGKAPITVSDSEIPLSTESGEVCPKGFKLIDADLDLGTFAVEREVLLKLLAPMTSDRVTLNFSSRGGVWMIGGMIGDKPCAAYLAPRVDDE